MYKSNVWDFYSYINHVNQWREFFASELVSYFKMTAIIRHNYQHLNVDEIDDEKFVLVFAEYLWVTEFETKVAVGK